MSFTQQHADENKAMASRADELVKESKFFDPPARIIPRLHCAHDSARPLEARESKRQIDTHLYQ